MVLSLLAGLARWAHPCELMSHFRIQYLAVLLLCALPLLVGRRWKWLAVVSLAAGLNAWWVLPWYLPAEQATAADNKPLRVMSLNVLATNQQYAAVLNVVKREQPDVLVLVEVNEDWERELASLNDDYIHNLWYSRSDAFGVALLSRIPIENFETLNLGIETPALLARCNWQGHVFHVMGVHFVTPVRPLYFEARNAQIQETIRVVQGLPAPHLLAGDLNLTMFSPFYQDLVEQTDLLNTRQGFGLTPTYPTFFPPAGIPIDHILHSPHFITLHHRSVDGFGSDHLGVVADLQWLE